MLVDDSLQGLSSDIFAIGSAWHYNGVVFVLPLAIQAPVSILPSDKRLVYVGRFDRRDPKAAACQWSASEVRLVVDGPKLTATIEEKGDDYWQPLVDGQPKTPITLKPGLDTYTVDLGGPGRHEVRLVKRTEPFVGTTTIRGFGTPGGKLLAAKPKKRHLEFVGDSITCGYGNEGANQNGHFAPATENATQSYASIAGRMVDADVTLIAWSGRKMWPDNTTPEIYDRILPTQPEPLYDFKGPAPDMVVINLATNDFGQENPEEKGWTGAYETFIRRVWSHYPKAHVVVALGGMMSDDYPQGHRALSTLRGYLTRLVGRMRDPRLHLVEFDQQRLEDGLGADWHPSVKTDGKMAARLVETLKRDVYR
ncbi:SGNH/GDSL hydrolase family protein [soil metagenome]